MTENFSFDVWLQTINLSDCTLEKLRTAGIHNVESILLLSQHDITALKIDIGDRGRFRKAIRKLKEQFPDSDDDEDSNISANGVDDSFDGTDREQLATQQRQQIEGIL